MIIFHAFSFHTHTHSETFTMLLSLPIGGCCLQRRQCRQKREEVAEAATEAEAEAAASRAPKVDVFVGSDACVVVVGFCLHCRREGRVEGVECATPPHSAAAYRRCRPAHCLPLILSIFALAACGALWPFCSLTLLTFLLSMCIVYAVRSLPYPHAVEEEATQQQKKSTATTTTTKRNSQKRARLCFMLSFAIFVWAAIVIVVYAV